MSVVAFARVLREELEEDLKSVEAGILGGISDHDSYRQAVGKRHGLMQALASLDDTVKRFDQAQD